jgi:cold shock protein
MPTGTVKFFSGKQGFGAITHDAGGPDVFVHVTAVERARMGGLIAGQRVSFDVIVDQASGSSAATNLHDASRPERTAPPRWRPSAAF